MRVCARAYNANACAPTCSGPLEEHLAAAAGDRSIVTARCVVTAHLAHPPLGQIHTCKQILVPVRKHTHTQLTTTTATKGSRSERVLKRVKAHVHTGNLILGGGRKFPSA